MKHVFALPLFLFFGCSSVRFSDEIKDASVDENEAPNDASDAASNDATEEPPVCLPGDQRPCACIGISGQEECSSTGWGFCRETAGNLCCSQPGEWKECWGDGCSVCADAVAEYPNYLNNHPNCVIIGCSATSRGECNTACPAPTALDK